MNDRFKFRCGITISHYDDDGNDIDTLLLIDTVSLFNNGEVGIDRIEIVKAIKRLNLSEEMERTIWQSLEQYAIFDDDFYSIPPDFIEQCTGLKDKNGNIIYEGDILKPNGNTITKEVVYEDGSYWAKDTIYFHDKCHIFQKWIDECGYKIIGNIHKVKEEQ